MKIIHRLLPVLFLLLALVSVAPALAGQRPSCSSGTTCVNGYTQSNGTQVAPYVRRAPGTASESHAFTATGGTTVIVSSPSQEGRDRIKAAVQEAPLPRGCSTAADREKVAAKQPPLYGWPEPPRSRVLWRNQEPALISSATVQIHRNSQARIQRSGTRKTLVHAYDGYPNGRPGYGVDQIVALKRGGPD
jgi:hypothetical protein